MKRSLCAGLFALAGCGAPAAAPAARAPVEAGAQAVASTLSAAVDAGAPRLRATRPEHAPPRVKSLSPGVQGIAQGAAVASDQRVSLGAGEELVLDFAAGARVRLIGPCAAQVAVAAMDALLVQRCTLSIDLTPAAPTPDSGFTLTTPSAALSLVRGGRLAVPSFATGASTGLVVSGSVQVSAAGSAFSGTEGKLLLGPGDRLDISIDGTSQRAPQPGSATVTTLEQAEQRVRALRETKPNKDATAALARALTSRMREVEDALARRATLVAAHRAAVSAKAADVMPLQTALSAQAAGLAKARRLLAIALSQRNASLAGAQTARADELGLLAEQLLHPSP